MDPQTLELLRLLQSGAHDAQSFAQIRALLSSQRRRLAAADDRATLADISELLEVWAEGAPPSMASSALNEAALIAEEDLEQAERAVQLYTQSLDRDPGELATLNKLEALLVRRSDRERFETLLATQADALVTRDGVDPSLAASLYLRLGGLRAARGDIGAAIEAYEQVLELNADPEILRTLADAYTTRGGVADAAQAADLYCALGDVSGATDGVQWLERALDQVPAHDESLDLLETYLPADQHADKLAKRWQAYVAHSDNESAADKRRMLLARVHAARGDAREALICLGPLIERSDAEATALQTECLATLRADEARVREASTNGAHHVNGNGKAVQKPPTLVGFRVPPADPQPGEGDAISEAQAKPAQQVSKRAVRSGETLVGFRVPPEFTENAKAKPAQEAKPAERKSPISVVGLRADAAATEVASARAAGGPRTASAVASAPSAKIAPRPTMKGGFAAALGTAPAPVGSGVLSAPAPAMSGPAAAAAALKAAAAARTSSAPPPAGPAAASVTAKAAALRAALRDTLPATQAGAPSALRPVSLPPVMPLRSSLPPAVNAVQAPAAQAAPPAAAVADNDDADVGVDTPSAATATDVAAAAEFPGASIAPTFAGDGFFAASGGGKSASKRWWIASSAALLVLGGVLALIFKPSAQPAPVVATARGESQAAMPMPVPAATPTPEPTAAPSAAAPAAAAPAEPTTATGAVAAAPAAAATPEPPAAAPAAPAPKAGPKPAVDVIDKKISVHGLGVTAKDVAAALDDSASKIERCYARTLDHDARAKGQITYGFTVDKAGHAAHVRQVKTTIKDTTLQRCVGDVIEKIRFPKAKKKPVKVTAPLDFHKA